MVNRKSILTLMKIMMG